MTSALSLEPVGTPRYSAIIGRPIDNTVLSTYMRCPSEAIKAYWMNRRKAGPPTPALAYGTAWHAAKETHFKAPECSEDELIQRVEVGVAIAWEDHGITTDHRTFDRCMLEYKKWLKKEGLPWRDPYRTLGWPTSPMVEMSGEVAIPGARHPYTFKIDRLAESGKALYVEDHKTTSQDNSDFYRSFEIDNQMMGYAVAGQLLTGRQVTGVRVCRHVVRKSDSVHDSQTIPYGQPRLIAWCKNYDIWLGRLETDLLTWRALIEQGMDPQAAADFAFPLNKWACHGRKYGRCPYVEVCSLPEHLRAGALEQDYDINVWNPLDGGDDV